MVNGRTEPRVNALAVEHVRNPAADPRRVSGVAADLTTAAGAQELFCRLPTVDILVNNLGIYQVMPFEESTDADWQRIFEVNVFSGVRRSRHYLPGMRQKNWGRIAPSSRLHSAADSLQQPIQQSEGCLRGRPRKGSGTFAARNQPAILRRAARLARPADAPMGRKGAQMTTSHALHQRQTNDGKYNPDRFEVLSRSAKAARVRSFS